MELTSNYCAHATALMTLLCINSASSADREMSNSDAEEIVRAFYRIYDLKNVPPKAPVGWEFKRMFDPDYGTEIFTTGDYSIDIVSKTLVHANSRKEKDNPSPNALKSQMSAAEVIQKANGVLKKIAQDFVPGADSQKQTFISLRTHIIVHGGAWFGARVFTVIDVKSEFIKLFSTITAIGQVLPFRCAHLLLFL